MSARTQDAHERSFPAPSPIGHMRTCVFEINAVFTRQVLRAQLTNPCRNGSVLAFVQNSDVLSHRVHGGGMPSRPTGLWRPCIFQGACVTLVGLCQLHARHDDGSEQLLQPVQEAPCECRVHSARQQRRRVKIDPVVGFTLLARVNCVQGSAAPLQQHVGGGRHRYR